MAKKDAETKEVKKTVKKSEKTTTTATKATFAPKDLRGKDIKVLLDDLKANKADLADARRSLAAGELVNPNVISNYRKTIARIQTIIVEKARLDHGKEDA